MDREIWFDHYAFYQDFMAYAKRRGFAHYNDQEALPDQRHNLRALCAELGISYYTLRNYSKGQPVSLDTVCRLAWWADLSLDKYIIPGGRIIAR